MTRPTSPLSQLSTKRYGVETQPVQSTPSVTATPSRLLRNNPGRVSWIVTNRDTVDAAVSFDGSKTFAQGFLVAANGGVVSMHADEDGESVGYELFGVSETGTVNLVVLEVLAL